MVKKKAAKAKAKNPNRARTKGDLLKAIAEKTGVAKKDVSAVVETLTKIMSGDLAKGPKVFALPGVFKATVVHKPATKARKGVNPFTGQEMMFKAKPARNVVKIRALKALKDSV
jgi:nucleoid DNA-binding protein